jgi:hypothetical protein
VKGRSPAGLASEIAPIRLGGSCSPVAGGSADGLRTSVGREQLPVKTKSSCFVRCPFVAPVTLGEMTT